MQHTLPLCIAGSAKHTKNSLSFTFRNESIVWSWADTTLIVQLLELCMAITSGSGKLLVRPARPIGRCATPAHKLPCADTLPLYVQLPVLCAACNAARGKLYSAGQDPSIRFWPHGHCTNSAQQPRLCRQNPLQSVQMPVLCAAYNAARGELYSAGQDPVIRVWEAVGGALLRRQPGHRGCAADQKPPQGARMEQKSERAPAHIKLVMTLGKDSIGVSRALGTVALRVMRRSLRQ